MNLLKKSFLVLSLAAFSTSLIGCTEDQVNVATGIAIGAIIGAALSDSPRYDRHHDHDDRYRPTPGRGRGRGGYGHRMKEISAEPSAELLAAKNISEKYDLSWEASVTLATPLVSAKNGNIEALTTLGITREDMILMFKGQNPSANTLTILAEKLSLSFDETHVLIQQMKSDVQGALASQ